MKEKLIKRWKEFLATKEKQAEEKGKTIYSDYITMDLKELENFTTDKLLDDFGIQVGITEKMYKIKLREFAVHHFSEENISLFGWTAVAVKEAQ